MYKFVFSRFNVLPLAADASEQDKARYAMGDYEYDERVGEYTVTVVDDNYESALVKANGLGPVREVTDPDAVSELTIDGEEVD